MPNPNAATIWAATRSLGVRSTPTSFFNISTTYWQNNSITIRVKANTIKLLSLTITYPRDDVSPLKIYANLSKVSRIVTPASNTPRSILFLNAKAFVINASTARIPVIPDSTSIISSW